MSDTDAQEQIEDLSGSYSVIDYRLRPAKHAERAMLVETAMRLRFGDLKSYRYVGFGAIYFSDFKVFHKNLGITDLHNIEGREVDKKRFIWNKPYSNIKMHFGMSSAVIPNMSWRKKSIVWLDYDGQLNGSKLKDIDFLIRNAASGSLLLFSVNAEKPSPVGISREDREKDLAAALKLLVGADRVKSSIKDQDLRGKFAAGVYYQIISDAIESAVSVFNRVADSEGVRRVWKQIIHITYKDGAQMLTVGGVIFEAKDEKCFSTGQFEKLSFYRPSSDSFAINVPKLTLKEMTLLEKSALLGPDRCSGLSFLKAREWKDYLKLVRYLPSYVSADL